MLRLVVCLFVEKVARVASVDTAVAILIDDTVAYCLKNFTVLLLLQADPYIGASQCKELLSELRKKV